MVNLDREDVGYWKNGAIEKRGHNNPHNSVAENVMKVFIVYCHPSKDSFTHDVYKSFERGLRDAGHEIFKRCLA